MIISASRRTDIPAFYAEWFINRVRAGWCEVPNPINPKQISHVSLKPEDVDAVVFWSKNPSPLIQYLDELNKRCFRYYFLFSLNGYPKTFEPKIPTIDERIKTFQVISDRLGALRIVWRYDPIIISNKTSCDFHREKFLEIATALKGYTSKVIVSLVDLYKKTRQRLAKLETKGYYLDWELIHSQTVWKLLRDLSTIAKSSGMDIHTCAEGRDFSDAGITPGRCIDGILLHQLWSLKGHTRKDLAQRNACLCVTSKDIGVNDTCIHGCLYCYSTHKIEVAQRRHAQHDPNSPMI